jgi:hypothetical protein
MKTTSLPAIRHTLRIILLTLAFLSGNLLHAQEASEIRVLKGKITVEDGKQYFVLKAPLEIEGKLVEKLDLQTDGKEKPDAGKPDTFIFLQGTVGKNPKSGIPQFRVKPLVINKPAGNPGNADKTANTSNPGVIPQTTLLPQTTQNFTSNTTNNTVNNNTTVLLNPTAPAETSTTASDADSKLAGKWKTSTDTGSISFLGQSGSFGTQFSLDLEKDRSGICKIGASAPLGLSNGVSFFGTWRTSSYQGKPTLVFQVKDYSTESIKLSNPPKEIIWYIKHVGESTLVLRENNSEYQLSK